MTHLSRYVLFEDLSEAELTDLAGAAVHRTVPDGEVLFRQGDPTPGLHLVERGAIKIYTLLESGEERIIDIIGPGEFCGEMGVVDRAPSAAWGEALGPARLCIIPAGRFEQVLLQHPALCLKVCRALVAKLRTAGAQLEEAIYLRSRERVLRAVLRLVERHGQPAPEGGQALDLRLTHHEIARVAGTARETVTRVLAELQDRRLLRFAGRRMLFPDPGALAALAKPPAVG